MTWTIRSQSMMRRAWVLALVTILSLGVTFTIYQPLRARPFHIVDFAEFIPILDRSSSWPAATANLVDYYASQGRIAPLAWTVLAAKWRFLGWWAPGWQLARAFLMLTLACLTYVLLRRLGASPLGGALAATLFMWAPAASDGWVKLSMNEPLGTALALAASLHAIHYQRSRLWLRNAVILGTAGTAVVLTKELLAPLVLLPVSLALIVQPDGSIAAPRFARRDIALLAIVSAMMGAALCFVVVTYVRADAAAYASLYGTTWQSPAALLAIWITTFIPFDPFPVPVHVLWAVGMLGLTALLATGWRMGWRDRETTVQARWLFLIALVVPLVGVSVYLPSPWYARFYSLPYLIGPAILLGMATTYLQAGLPAGRRLSVLCWVPLVLLGLGGAAELASRTAAVQRRDDAVISAVFRTRGADSALFATSKPPPAAWDASSITSAAPRSLGTTLNRFSKATGRPWPPTRDVGCDEAQTTLTEQRAVVVVNFQSSCALSSARKQYSAYYFRRLDWRRYRIVVDSIHAAIVPPSGSRVQQ